MVEALNAAMGISVVQMYTLDVEIGNTYNIKSTHTIFHSF
jgi:hypothetical protein